MWHWANRQQERGAITELHADSLRRLAKKRMESISGDDALQLFKFLAKFPWEKRGMKAPFDLRAIFDKDIAKVGTGERDLEDPSKEFKAPMTVEEMVKHGFRGSTVLPELTGVREDVAAEDAKLAREAALKKSLEDARNKIGL